MIKSILFLCISLFIQSKVYTQSHTYENIVFEGAGIRGIAYSGVIKQLEVSGILSHIQKAGGTSAGAITALMVSLGYSSDEIYTIISDTQFRKFNDGQFIFFGGFSRLNRKFGWYKGNKANQWIEKIIKQKTQNQNITFKELQDQGYKQLYITATCMNKQKLLIFSSENYPDMKVKDAIRISMSIPLYFEAVFIDSVGKMYKKYKPEKNMDVVVDGGIIGNFPIFMFDSITTDEFNNTIRIPDYKTLGIRIDSEAQIGRDAMDKKLVPVPIHRMRDYLEAFYILVLENLNRNHLTPEDWERTISVSSIGIGPRIKKLSSAQKADLMKSGEKYTLEYLQTH